MNLKNISLINLIVLSSISTLTAASAVGNAGDEEEERAAVTFSAHHAPAGSEDPEWVASRQDFPENFDDLRQRILVEGDLEASWQTLLRAKETLVRAFTSNMFDQVIALGRIEEQLTQARAERDRLETVRQTFEAEINAYAALIAPLKAESVRPGGWPNNKQVSDGLNAIWYKLVAEKGKYVLEIASTEETRGAGTDEYELRLTVAEKQHYQDLCQLEQRVHGVKQTWESKERVRQ